MALHAFHKSPTPSPSPSGFQSETARALDLFRALRSSLEGQVRNGLMTPRVARQQARAAAKALADDLRGRSGEFSTVSRIFPDRLSRAAADRASSRESLPMESLLRETNKLLRDMVNEQRLAQRTPEFEARAYVRPTTPGGQPVATTASLLEFHNWATQAGDEPAREWARRQLEKLRPLVVSPDDHRRIDLACDRPDRVNPRLVGAYVEAMKGQPTDELEAFVEHAIAERDANACVSAYLIARETPDPADHRWVRSLLDGLAQFPDAALNTVREIEADASREDQRAALEQAEQAIAQAENEARLDGLSAPTDADLARLDRLHRTPAAAADEPIGLSPVRRGMTPDEFNASQRPVAPEAGSASESA